MSESQTWDVSPQRTEGPTPDVLVATAVRALGLAARRVETLSPSDGRKRGRSAHRVELASGGLLKARVLESADAVDALLAVRASLEAAFAPTFGGHGRVLVEEWVEGRALSESEADARIEEAASLLGRLHASTTASPVQVGSTQHWRQRAEADLAELAGADSLEAAEIEALRELLVAYDPGRAPLAMTHRDFCPENMLIDPLGHLRVIDNELFDPAPPGYDVGRTLYRWPMSSAQQQRFLAAYESEFALDREPLAFWLAASVLLSARVRGAHSAQRRAVPLAAARALAAAPQRLLAQDCER